MWTFGYAAWRIRDHLHVQRVIVHRDVAIFGHHEINSDDARIGGSDFEAEERLREDLLFRKAAQHLIEIADLDAARGRRIGCAAVLAFAAHGLGLIEVRAGDGDIIAQSC